MTKIPLIVDCDNTMGLFENEIDDGITLMYLLGRDDIDLLGITLTHGNGTLAQVEEAHRRFSVLFGLQHIPFFLNGEAADFLAQTTAARPKEISVLAIGAQSNLFAASQKDPRFYHNVKSIALMGGICTPLFCEGRPLPELNFSVDAEAAHSVLMSPAPIALINGHCGADALMKDSSIEALCIQGGSVLALMAKEIDSWLQKMRRQNCFGFVNWDTAAAVLLLEPHWFSSERVSIAPTVESLKTGMLNPVHKGAQSSKEILMPAHILDPEAFNAHVSQMLVNFSQKYNG